MLVAIEGIDGSGKATLTGHLVQLAIRAGHAAGQISFPRYGETKFSHLVSAYLNGDYGTLEEVPAQFAALLYAGDRYESRTAILEAMARWRILFLDRYVASNLAYQTARLPAAERQAFLAWLSGLEFDLFELPRPDLTLLMATPAEVARDLVARKGTRSYTEKQRDLHEADQPYLAAVAEMYNGLAKAATQDWRTIIATADDGSLRPPEELAREAWSHIDGRLA